MFLPKLRFKDFNNEWSQHKIGDFFEHLATGSTPSRLNSDYFKGDIPWISSGELKAHYVSTTNEYITEKAVKETNLKIYPPGTMFIAITGLEAKGTRSSAAINTIPMTTNQSCLAFPVSDSINLDFLYFWYKKNGEEIGITYTQGTKQQSLTPLLVKNLDIFVPSFNEQSKIAQFFNLIEKKIEYQQGKINLLKEQKKGFMQKIFRQELRFKNFRNNWEIKTVSNVATLVNGRAYKKEELLDQGKYRVLRVGNFFTNDSWYFSDLELDPDKYANKEDLLYAWSASFGPKIWKEEKVIYHYHIWKVIPNEEKVLRDFLYHWFTFDKTRILSQKNGSTLVHITKGGLEETNIEIPCLDEQKAISNFFNILESKISLAEENLAILNQQKQAFMQQMFI